MFRNYMLLWVLLIAGCTTPPRQTYDLALTNATVIDLETGAVKSQDIYINDDRITKLVDRDTENVLSAKRILDLKGKFVLPGFWDNHVHFRGGDSLIEANKNFLKLFLANGITTVRDAGGDLTQSVLLWREQMDKGELFGPTIFTSGPKLDGKNPTWAGSLEVEDEADIQTALDSLQAIPTDFVKLYESTLSGENYLKIIRATEQRGLITSGHMPFTVTLGETVEAGIDGIEHLYYVMKGCAANEREITEKMKAKEIGFWGAMPLLLGAYNDSVALTTFNNLKNNNVYVVPTLHIGETLSSIDEVDHSQDTYLNYMAPGIIKTYEGRIRGAMKASPEQRKNRKELQRFFTELAKSLHDAEVSLLAGSDSGAYNSYTYPGISLHKELEAMVAAGIPAIDALRASAYNGAHFLKKEEHYGLVKERKLADLVILNGNPLENISETQNIHMVVKEGTTFEINELETQLKSY
jgi:imidazolonepropionase-like amidohydrolase